MPAFNFQKQFVSLIINGTKTSTIRKLPFAGVMLCLEGDILELMQEICLVKTVKCTAIDLIGIAPTATRIVVSKNDGSQFSEDEMQRLWRTEGFESLKEMEKYFIDNFDIYKQNFYGWHIKWEPLS